MELDSTPTRHAKVADDSQRICIVLPKVTCEEIKSYCDAPRPTFSSMIRDFIMTGLYLERKKRNEQ